MATQNVPRCYLARGIRLIKCLTQVKVTFTVAAQRQVLTGFLEFNQLSGLTQL